MDRKLLEQLRKTYKPGTRVKLTKMNDIQAPPVGTKGTVQYVDDIASIGVAWDNGSSLSLVYGEDSAQIIES